jgi:Fe-S-cluster containining protein
MAEIHRRKLRWMMRSEGSRELSSGAGCLKCPGYCCRAFWTLKPSVTDIKHLRDLLRRKGGIRTVMSPRSIYQEIRNVRFGLNHFVVLGQDEEGNPGYTCNKFDEKLGKCTAYYSRPRLCRIYRCSASAGGPTASYVKEHFGDRSKWGKKVLRARREQRKEK